MKNKEYITNLRPDDMYTALDWVFHEYGMRSTNTRHAVINWLEQETIVGKWQRVSGYATAGGDPVYVCPVCRHGEHVYGIEHQNGRKFMCENCGAFNNYYERTI